jgi:ABC-type Mn2+/Zn2+ transport system ATPase subunit
MGGAVHQKHPTAMGCEAITQPGSGRNAAEDSPGENVMKEFKVSDVKNEDFIVIVGPQKSGKSTLARKIVDSLNSHVSDFSLLEIGCPSIEEIAKTVEFVSQKPRRRIIIANIVAECAPSALAHAADIVITMTPSGSKFVPVATKHRNR